MQLVLAQPEHLNAVQDLLEGAAARDRLLIPVAAADALRGDAWLALDPLGRAVGVGWRHDGPEAVIDIRVAPEARRQGIGGALLERLLARSPGGPLLAGCDAGHQRAARFVRRRGFSLVGVVFFQRWDGAPQDVPRAFRHARLRPGADPAADWALLQAAAADTWPPPVVDAADLARASVRTRVAWVDEAPVGIVVASREGDAWVAGGFAVTPAWRARGIGRQLLGDLMTDAAAEGLGVVLRVAHTAAKVQAWTQALGFWTYRSWAYWRHPGVKAEGSPETLSSAGPGA